MLKLYVLSQEELQTVAEANGLSTNDIPATEWPTDINDGTSYFLSELVVRRGVVFDDSEAAFDLTEAGDVKLRGSLVWLKGYAKEETEVDTNKPEDGWVEIYNGVGDVTNQAQVETEDGIEWGTEDEEEGIRVSVLIAGGVPVKVSVEPSTYNGNQAEEAVESTFPGYKIEPGAWDGHPDCVTASIVQKACLVCGSSSLRFQKQVPDGDLNGTTLNQYECTECGRLTVED